MERAAIRRRIRGNPLSPYSLRKRVGGFESNVSSEQVSQIPTSHHLLSVESLGAGIATFGLISVGVGLTLALEASISTAIPREATTEIIVTGLEFAAGGLLIGIAGASLWARVARRQVLESQ